MHQTTVTLQVAQQLVQQQHHSQRQQQLARYQAFQEFKTSYHDLMDAADWQHYVEATGLQLATLARFSRRHAEAPLRVFARAAGDEYFEPLDVRTGQWTECAYQATKATPQLLAFLKRANPGWEFKASRSLSEANEPA
jgi:hypothetical protein